MDNITRFGSPGISQRTEVYAERKMLRHAAPVMVLDYTGPMLRPQPKNTGQVVKFRRPVPFTAATTPLVEGVTPSARQFLYEDVTVQQRQYGDIVRITDHIEDTHEDPVLNDISVQSGENIGRTVEALDYGVIRAGTNVFYANGTSRTVVNTTVTMQLLRNAIRGLKRQKAMKVTQILDASPKFATRAVEAAYIVVAHTDLENDIRGLPGFTPCANYGSRQMICEHELGSVEEMRFITSPDLEPWVSAGGAPGGNVLSTNGANADVYPLLVFGKEAWVKVPLRGAGSLSPSIIPPNQRSKSDPLGQRGSVGWKMWHASVIANDGWMCRLEVAATQL
jgi:N4-gp56 family major capsid protein